LENHSGKDLTIISPKTYSPVPENIKVILDWKQADAEILSAETIISRNGYSTLMDLKFLNKKVILIPTPGQLEQEYLSSIKA
jgi:predicted glycosyltransferase